MKPRFELADKEQCVRVEKLQEVVNRTSTVKIKQASTQLIYGQTKVVDIEDLSLYLRKRIRKYCLENKSKVPEILIKNGYVTMQYEETEKVS
nr:unnamed protein product [Haemonchus contortus]